MLALVDRDIRFSVLCYVVTRSHEEPRNTHDAAPAEEALSQLRELPMADLKIIASLRHPSLYVSIDATTVADALRHLAAIKKSRGLEQYFIRHGASPGMMKTHFKISIAKAILRLRAQGYAAQSGRPRMPQPAVRDRMHQCWSKHAHLDLKNRYYQLHEAFPSYTLHTLHAVVVEFEADK